jgi:hypothetical protein
LNHKAEHKKTHGRAGKERTTAEVHGNAEFAIFKNGVTL